MFSSNKKTPEIDTTIGDSTKIYGNIHYSGRLHIDGTIVGNVVAEKDGSILTISEGGKIEGNVQVHRIELNGEIVGDVYAINDIRLASNAHVSGNLYYDKIEMDSGSEVNGNMIHGKPPEAIASEPASAESVAATTTVDSSAPVNRSTTLPVDNVVAAAIPAKPAQAFDTQSQSPKIKVGKI